jgi:hypothetical protein
VLFEYWVQILLVIPDINLYLFSFVHPLVKPSGYVDL